MANSSNQVLWFSASYYQSLTDDELFEDHAIKCRCCFRKIQAPISEDKQIIQFHRESFENLTSVELSRNPGASMHICSNCDLLLQAFIEFKEIAGETQKRYSEYLERVGEEIQQQAAAAEIVDLTAASDIDEQEIEPDTSRDERHLVSPGNDGIEQQLADISENEEVSTTSTRSSETLSLCCDLCDYRSKIKGILSHHMISRHRRTPKLSKSKFKCLIDGCNKSFNFKNRLEEHHSRVHQRDSQEHSTCEICGKSYKNKALLRNHSIVHKRQHKCKTCGKSFGQNRQLVDHVSTYHENVQFKCERCPSSFKSQWKLQTHQQRYHQKKKCQCDRCEAAFCLPNLLSKHVKVQHEGMRYHCSYPGCSSSFTAKSVVVTHLRRVHCLENVELKKYTPRSSRSS